MRFERASNFRADDDAIDGLCFNQGETNDSLSVDIPKTDVRPMIRRKEGAKYVIYVESRIDGCGTHAKSGK